MHEEKMRKFFRHKLFILFVLFTLSYIVFLPLWLTVQDYYGKGMLIVASHVTAKVKNIDFFTVQKRGDGQFGAEFYFVKKGKPVRLIFKFDLALFTFNAPLTFAVMTALFPVIRRRKRGYLETLLILISIHFLYVFTSEAGRITYLLDKNNLEHSSEMYQFIWQYAFGFIDALLIKFEPFLIGIYLYMRFSKTNSLTRRTQEKR